MAAFITSCQWKQYISLTIHIICPWGALTVQQFFCCFALQLNLCSALFSCVLVSSMAPELLDMLLRFVAPLFQITITY